MAAPLRTYTDAARAGPLALAAGLLFACLAQTPHAPAQAPRLQNDGLFIPVPGRLDSSAVDQIEAKIKAALKRPTAPVRKVILDFNPEDQATATGDVYMAMRLMRFVRGLRQQHPNLLTVAFVHNDVSRHTVLPVLACKEIVMSPKARIGRVLLREDPPLSPEARSAYEEVAGLWPSPDLIRKMIDPGMTLRRVQTPGGPRYIDERIARDRGKLKQALEKLRITFASDEDFAKRVHVEAGVPPGLGPGEENTWLDARRARDEYELCKREVKDRNELARQYGLPLHTLHENALLGRTRVGWRIDLTSTVNKAKLDSLERRIKAAIGRGANVIILHLDCEGGDTDDVVSTARELSRLKDQSGAHDVLTIAYVPPRRSLGAATFLALGCSQILMAKDSYLGDFEYLKNSGGKLESARAMLPRMADERGVPAALFRATLQPDLTLFRVRSKTDPGRFWVLTADELENQGKAEKEDNQPAEWERDARLPTPKGEWFKISAPLANEWGIARFADVENVEDLYKRCELDPARVRVSRDDWLDKVAEFFREEVVKIFLVMIGIAGLILELKMPGTGVPGVVAAICFVLFFWAHSFVGQFTLLAVFLFLLGLIMIGLEIFVLPGFGVTGISGIALVIASLVLVTLERMPETTQDWLSIGATVTTLGISLVAAIVGACVLAWYLPHIPFASRLVLQPPTEDERGVDRDAFGGRPDEAAALLGAIGVAATTLRPAGKVRFGDEYVDVVAEGAYVTPGTRVQVVEIEGNRIVVKEV
jgi:membrane-bound ClpP family serine protease